MSSIQYWDTSNLNLQDELNAEIWLDSPIIQQAIQPTRALTQSGAIGAQQAMLHGSYSERVLPWVPDIVGTRVGDKSSILIIGPHYSGFIRSYSRRRETMSLEDYLTASTPSDFLKLFMEKVVRFDDVYYHGIKELLDGLVEPTAVGVLDLCRASFVRRGSGVVSRRDEASEEVVKAAWQIYTRYVESEQPREWTLRRIRESNAQVIITLGTIAEHGLLRLFASQGSLAKDRRSGQRLSLSHTGLNWTARTAHPRRPLRYWYTKHTCWETQLAGRRLFILPVHQPFRVGVEDPHYQKTRLVLSEILETASGLSLRSAAPLFLKRYRSITGNESCSGILFAEDLATNRTVMLKRRLISDARKIRILEREVQMLSLLNRPEFLQCTDYGCADGWEIAVYEFHPEARRLAAVIDRPMQQEQSLVGPGASLKVQLHFLQSVAEALNALHSHGIVHGNLSSEAVWVWPVGGIWLSKLDCLDCAAARAVSPNESIVTQVDDVRGFADLVSTLLATTTLHERDSRWHHLNSMASKVAEGEIVDAGVLLDAISKPEVKLEERINGFMARIASSPRSKDSYAEAVEIVRMALSEGRISDSPREVWSYVANSSPDLLGGAVDKLKHDQHAVKAQELISVIVDVLNSSMDVDSVHCLTCRLLLDWRPPNIHGNLIRSIYRYGCRFLAAHQSEEVRTSAVHFCCWAHGLDESEEHKRWWIERIQELGHPEGERLVHELSREATPSHRPRARVGSLNARRVIPQSGHHLDREKVKQWVKTLGSRFDYVWRVEIERTLPAATPAIGSPCCVLGKVKEAYLPIVLGEEFTENKMCVRLRVFFAPETTKEQLEWAKEQFLASNVVAIPTVAHI
jgi:hypothetical protein